MKKMNLQRFDNQEGIQGKKIIYLYREYSKAGTEAGWTMAFTTENGRTVSVDSDSTPTKSGAIRVPGSPEIEITGTSIFATNDTRVDELEDACLNSTLMEIWEVNLKRPGATSGKYKGKYFQGYLTEFEITANAEDFAEVAVTFGINGKGERGDCTVSAEQEQEASYAFRDTVKTGA